MKIKLIKIRTILVILLSTQLIWCNNDDNEYKTILGGRPLGAYGAFDFGYSEIELRPTATFGARGGVIFGHNFALGVGGRAFINEYNYVEAINRDASLVGGYGGFFAEWIIAPKFPVHISVPALVGLGGVAYSTLDQENSDYVKVNDIENTETFFIAEPGIELELNMTKFFRIAVYGSYRYTTDLNWTKTPVDVLNGYSAGLIFKFGKF